MRRTIFIAIAIALAIFMAKSASASTFDPGAGWRTIFAPHFRIHHPEHIAQVAREAADILEEIHPVIVEKWNWKPWSYTEVILTDSTDMPNGLASVLPYNWMLIFITPPDPDSSLGHYDEWLRMLLIHEYTHIVQIDAIGGAWHPVRLIFGKTVSPSGMNPVWLREGIAEYAETYFTKGGRGRGSYSEMVVRTSALDDTFPEIDQADGLGWKWPGYKASYIYGIKFISWLIDKYGEEKFLQLDERIRSSLLLGMLNHQSRNVYDRTFYELWDEWHRELIDDYHELKGQLSIKGLTQPAETIVPAHYDGQYDAPTLSPDGTKLVYTQTSPHDKPEIRLFDLKTGETEVIKKGHNATQFAFSPDGTKLAYSATGRYKRFYNYFDLWLYDFGIEKKKHRLKRLTKGARARDPDFDRTGNSLIFITLDTGTERLERIDIKTKDRTVLTKDVPNYTQFANPRVSPDGRFIAVSVWKPDLGWRIWRYAIDGVPIKRLTNGEGLAIESRPTWTPDGRQVIFSSDESGISNLYSVTWDGKNETQITNLLTGAFQPAVSSSYELYGQYYTSKGFVISRFDMPALKGGKSSKYKKNISKDEPETFTSFERQDPESEQKYMERKYVAFGQSLFLPRFILPALAYMDDALFASLMTGGADVLRWHNWLAGATYRSDANYFGYFGRYWYNRYRVIFGVSVRDYAVDFGTVYFDRGGGDIRQVHLYEKRRGATAFIGIPYERHSFNVAYFYEDHDSKTALTPAEKAALNLGIFAGIRTEYRYGDAETFPASISKEDGRNIRLTVNITNKHLGSADRNEQVIFSGDWREYVRLYRHHVLALRAAGGITWGDRLIQGTFGLGGAIGEGTLAGGGSYNYFALRGLPVSALSRTRAMLFSAEYRFPIISLQRGLGTTPIFLKDLSGAIFADYGNAWNAHERGSDSIDKFFDDFLLGVGFELRGNFILGHGLPIHGRLGYAIIVVNRDRVTRLKDPLLGTNIKYGMLVLALGYAF